ncbi:hypothetical protein SALBM135S_09827 [Streptomyces alboniger]
MVIPFLRGPALSGADCSVPIPRTPADNAFPAALSTASNRRSTSAGHRAHPPKTHRGGRLRDSQLGTAVWTRG